MTMLYQEMFTSKHGHTYRLRWLRTVTIYRGNRVCASGFPDIDAAKTYINENEPSTGLKVRTRDLNSADFSVTEYNCGDVREAKTNEFKLGKTKVYLTVAQRLSIPSNESIGFQASDVLTEIMLWHVRGHGSAAGYSTEHNYGLDYIADAGLHDLATTEPWKNLIERMLTATSFDEVRLTESTNRRRCAAS